MNLTKLPFSIFLVFWGPDDRLEVEAEGREAVGGSGGVGEEQGYGEQLPGGGGAVSWGKKY